MTVKQVKFILGISAAEYVSAIVRGEIPVKSEKITPDVLLAYATKHNKDIDQVSKRYLMIKRSTGNNIENPRIEIR